MPDEEEEEEVRAIPTKGYCKMFSLQAGTCITSTVGATLMITVMIYNCISENRQASVKLQFSQYFLLYFYSIIMLVGFGMISFASFLAVPKTLTIGYYLNLFGFLLWIVLCVVGYIPSNDAFKFVCIDNRCPEVHWMYDTRWRNYGFPCPFGEHPMEIDPDTEDEEDDAKSPLEPMGSLYIGCENYSKWPLATSTILGILWGGFVSYGLFTCTQFKKELMGDMEYE